MKANYSKGIPVQPTVYYYENGQIRLKITFDENGLKSKEEAFYESGSPYSLVNFNKGLEEGETRLYHPNGQLKELRSYKKGKMVGNRDFFNEEGLLIRTEKN